MPNDQPTSLRMGFGARQAFEAGIDGFSVPSTADMNVHLRTDHALKELDSFLKQNPSLRPRALELMQVQRAKWPVYFPHLILLELRRPKPKINRRGR